MSALEPAAAFTDLPDLASETLGGAAIACNDEFFAEKENLLKPHAAVWKDHEYTDRGKWMDGWETRRFRPPTGIAPARDSDVHDWCVVRLGMPGAIRGVVVDTAWFRGNYPDQCALFAATIDAPLDLQALQHATWTEILPRTQLQGDTKNAFAIDDDRRYTHVRLHIFPDGGVARLRVHGEVRPDWPRIRALGGPIDLAALENGAVVESCSDMFFGSRTNLIKPGPSLSMADGWETRRRRGPGHDWAIVRLAAPGTLERVLLDTSHFKGNAPARIALEGVDARHQGPEGSRVAPEAITGWRPLLETPAQAHRRHVFDHELRRIGTITHVRVSVFPCGGIARLRAWGVLEPASHPGLERLNAESVEAARGAFLECCGSSNWADAMTAARPFEDTAALVREGERVWWSLHETDHRQAFAAHPKIGATKPPAVSAATATWTAAEQAGTSNAAAVTLDGLATANREYEAKHGFIYIVCASGRSAEAMLADCRARISRPGSEEMRTAAEEQAAITRLRLHKLLGELATGTTR